jgi:hypothetical protein
LIEYTVQFFVLNMCTELSTQSTEVVEELMRREREFDDAYA